MPAATPTMVEALLAVQQEISQIDFPKTARNPHFSSNYCPLDVILEKTLPVLNKHGFVLVQQVTTVEDVAGVHGALKTRLWHVKSDEKIEDTMLLMPLKENPQNQGAAITYARRYAVQTLLGIVPEDDVDGTQKRTEPGSGAGHPDSDGAGGFDSGASPI